VWWRCWLSFKQSDDGSQHLLHRHNPMKQSPHEVFPPPHVAGVTKIRGTDELDGDLEDAASPKGTTPGSSLKADSAGAVSLADSEALV